MLQLNNYYNTILITLGRSTSIKGLFNRFKIKNNTYKYLQMKSLNAHKNYYFDNQLNIKFKNNIEIAKRYIQNTAKLFPINLIEIDKRLWINSDFYNSYKNKPEVWHEINLSNKMSNNCLNIKKVISLSNYYVEVTEQNVRYKVISYQANRIVNLIENEPLANLFDIQENTVAFGELGSGDPFIIDYNFFSEYDNGEIVIASNWEELIDYMNDKKLDLFVDGMHNDNLKQVRALQKNKNKYVNSDDLRLLLKESLS